MENGSNPAENTPVDNTEDIAKADRLKEEANEYFKSKLILVLSDGNINFCWFLQIKTIKRLLHCTRKPSSSTQTQLFCMQTEVLLIWEQKALVMH